MMITDLNQLINTREYWIYEEEAIKQITVYKPGVYSKKHIGYWFIFDDEGYKDRLYIDSDCPLFETLKELIQYYHPEYFE